MKKFRKEVQYMRDVSSWEFVSHGEKSTLEKEEILSPNNIAYIMKYPRQFDESRVNWEDINEVVASKIAKLLNISTVEAEVAYRNKKRGCLMLHFLHQFEAEHGEPGGPLLAAQFGNEYKELKNSNLNSLDLIYSAFSLMERFNYFKEVKFDFVMMNVFDILIGNQDRHSYNWQILFRENDIIFSPLYDNGASLGWQLNDSQLKKMLNDQAKMNKYYKNTKVKAGILEDTQPKFNAKQILAYCKDHYPDEICLVGKRLEHFDVKAYNQYIEQFPLISETRKEFLKQFVPFRLEKILSVIQKEGV